MANSYTGNVIKLDTAGTTTDDTEMRTLTGISWESSAAAESLILKNSKGDQIWSATSTAEQLTISAPVGTLTSVPGIHASTLDGGTVHIYQA